MNRGQGLGLVAVVAGTTAGCDQSAKLIASTILEQTGPIDLAGGLLRLQFVLNHGGFLGLGGGLSPSLRWWLFTFGVSLALLVVLRMAVARERPPLQVVALALILGGGIGNLLDRLALSGAVRDFAILGIGRLRTGVFNLADAAILLGAFVLLATTLQRSHPASRTPPEGHRRTDGPPPPDLQ